MMRNVVFFMVFIGLISMPLTSAIHTIAFFQIDLSNLEEVAVVIPTRYGGFQEDFERDFDKFSISVDGKECEFLGEQFQQYFFKCSEGEKLILRNDADLTGYVHFYGYVFVNSKEVIEMGWGEKEYEVDLSKNTEQQHTHITISDAFPVRTDFRLQPLGTNEEALPVEEEKPKKGFFGFFKNLF